MRSLGCKVVWLTPVLLLAGCATDSRDGAISSVINHVNTARNRIEGAKEIIEKAVEKAEKADPKKIDAKDLEKAFDEIKGLTQDAKDMQKVKLKIDAVAASTTKEEQAALRERFQKSVDVAMADIQKARAELERAVQRAEALDAETGKKLRTELTEAEGAFVTLARRH